MSTIINTYTGERISLSVNKKEAELKLSNLTDAEKSQLLIQILHFRKTAEVYEKLIKNHASNTKLEFNEKDKAMWNEFQISKEYRKVFDADKFETEGTKEEKSIVEEYKKICDKYKKFTEFFKFK